MHFLTAVEQEQIKQASSANGAPVKQSNKRKLIKFNAVQSDRKNSTLISAKSEHTLHSSLSLLSLFLQQSVNKALPAN